MNRPLTIQEWFESLGKMVEEFDWNENRMTEYKNAQQGPLMMFNEIGRAHV